MAEELTNSQETTSEEIVPAEETTDVPSDADLEDTDSLTFSGGVVRRRSVSLALRDVPNVWVLVETGLTEFRMYLVHLIRLKVSL